MCRGSPLGSSLDGKKVLPPRTRWIAYPKPASAQIEEVDFLIDGKVRWILSIASAPKLRP
jgi:hypothetical protein